MDQNIFFSQQDADHVAGDRACMFMSRIATRASSLINSFIFVNCHKQRIVSVYEDRNMHLLEQKCGLQGHGVQRKMISVDNFFVFLGLLFFAVLLLYVT